MRLGLRSLFFVLLASFGASCAKGGEPSLQPVPSQTATVNETLRVPLVVDGGGGKPLAFRFVGPDLPGLASTTSISGTGAGGEFRWTPLASHVGEHPFEFVLTTGGGNVLDSVSTVIVVEPADDAAPVFLRPGAGGTYDLTRDPCVEFDVEVRDDDSERVEIRAREDLPEGAVLRREGPKQARFEWCPSPDQIAASERWTVALEADDTDHEPVPHDYVIVLRTGDKEGCPGEPPSITVVEPDDGARVESSSGWPVVVRVDDDMGALRDPPLLFYTTAEPDDLADPDVTTFEQVAFEADGDRWQARVPALGLGPGDEQTVYLVVSATDNDDPTGTACDHRTDTDLRTFVAVRVEGGSELADCEVCSGSSECASGVCATAAEDDRCVPSCADGGSCASGTCQDVVTTEGSVARACGDVVAVCEGGGGSCTDDGREDDDTLSEASDASAGSSIEGTICADDPDYYRMAVTAGTQVDVTLDFVHADGDLDLHLLDDAGTILGTSAGVTDTEAVGYCADGDGALFAKVFGYDGAENDYTLGVSTSAGDCCADDELEDDDSFATARMVTPDDAIDGTICPGDSDWAAFEVPGPSIVRTTITFVHEDGDLDLELYGPDGGVVASSRTTSDIEEIVAEVSEAGTYAMRVFGYLDASGDYLGELEITPMSGCDSDFDCPISEICDGGSCVDRTCTSSSECPTGYECPVAGPTPPPLTEVESQCGSSCSINRDCRSSEACKRFPEGRYCGRTGDGANGDACATFADCGGQRACLTWPAGYCARVGCVDNGDCESDTFCVTVDGTNVCARDCWASDDICRLSEGYSCDVMTDTAGSYQFVCVPS